MSLRKNITVKGKIVTGVLVLALVILVSAWASAKPPVTLTVLRYTTNQSLSGPAGSTYICAVIAVTNQSKQSLQYWSFGGLPDHCDYEVLRRTTLGWKANVGLRCGTGLELKELAPAQGFTFEAHIPIDETCKVELRYWDGRTPNPIWQKLPRWIVARLPWATTWHAARTKVIDVRDAKNDLPRPTSS